MFPFQFYKRKIRKSNKDSPMSNQDELFGLRFRNILEVITISVGRFALNLSRNDILQKYCLEGTNL